MKIVRTIAEIIIKLVLNVLNIFYYINSRKRYSIPFYGLIVFIAYIVLLIEFSGDANYQTILSDKRINDVTKLNPIAVNKIIKPHSLDEISNSIRNSTGAISIGGGRYSMGGQTAFENSIHFDMREFNNIISIDTVNKQVTVQPGILWKELQLEIDKKNLSIKIMQTYANFTVGGSISVNCHGRYIGHGPIISSVKSLKIINAYGELVYASRDSNREVFNSVVGGYGGIGVIVEATLQLDDNVKVERQNKYISINNYNIYFAANIKNNKDVIFQNGDLYPPNYDEVNVVTWKKSNKPLTETERLTPDDENYWIKSKVVDVVSWGDFGKWLRKSIIDPYIYRSEIVKWRNKEASYSVLELEPSSRENQTYVLQEYFIPVNNIVSFTKKMKDIFNRHNANILNVSLRHAIADNESFLSWAKEEVFAFVVYYKQGTDKESREKVKNWTLEMTDAILSENGSWYLPYQPHAYPWQFNRAYPNADKYFAVKKLMDSNNRFNNKLLDRYNPMLIGTLDKYKNSIVYYKRAEEQTYLTVPEWYLVYNPKEYADFLTNGNNPSDFPYYKSIDEYWKLYDRSKKLVSKAYPDNKEYMTMLQVIGFSFTLEYGVKIIYENTIGRLFSIFYNGIMSDEEIQIAKAQKDYSDFIYNTAWYEFSFYNWVNKVWSVNNTKESNWIRKTERKIFFTIEFLAKACYGQLIEWAARASYETPITNIYSIIKTSQTIPENDKVKVIKSEGNKKLIAIKRWGDFTSSLIAMSDLDFELIEIGGNKEIVVSVIVGKNENLNYSNIRNLYESQIVSNSKLKRLVLQLPVSELMPFVRYTKKQKIELEHIYDY